ncbi:MAG: acetyl-CoA carboxylase biotin carboxyl carrier protein subunit [Spirochaetia bacterium]|nr:acetyl-CoA carboxylase biotin carboxyl carrier protein subunit [Spirochaetia bacterium]
MFTGQQVAGQGMHEIENRIMIKAFAQDGAAFTVEVQKQGTGFYAGISIDGKPDNNLAIEALQTTGKDSFEVQTAQGVFPGRFLFAGKDVYLYVKGQAFRFQAATAAELAQSGISTHRSPMPGKVIAVPVAVGDSVQKDQTVVIVEAMKMENAIKAGLSGKVKAVHCKVGDLISPDLNLIEIEG